MNWLAPISAVVLVIGVSYKVQTNQKHALGVPNINLRNSGTTLVNVMHGVCYVAMGHTE